MKKAVLFDLGNTLVRYWPRAEFPGILREAIGQVSDYVAERGLLRVPEKEIWQRVAQEDHGSPDFRVRPLEGLLCRIFALEDLASDEITLEMCRRFLIPIFRRGQVYDDALPTLEALRNQGIVTAIISNTPWGSPAALWHEEVERLGLSQRVDLVVFCGDVGWRKPARQIFDYTLARLGVAPEQCLFVGDDPRWDLVGPRAVGMEAILIDRSRSIQCEEEQAIHSLGELWDILGI